MYYLKDINQDSIRDVIYENLIIDNIDTDTLSEEIELRIDAYVDEIMDHLNETIAEIATTDEYKLLIDAIEEDGTI